MKKLNEAALKRGDIILVTSNDLLNTIIKLGTRGDISHALIYVQDYSVIDATDDGVHARNTQRLFYNADCPLYVLRLRGGLTPAQADIIVNYARQQVGAQYTMAEAALAATPGPGDFSRKQFCSRLAAQAYAAAGIQLFANPNYCSPADLKASPLLTEVKNAVQIASAAEIAFSDDIADIPQIMRDTTNIVLEGVRGLGCDIQTLNDVTTFLIDHPEHDARIFDLYVTSGYLDVWKVDIAKHPEHYDLALMRAGGIPPDARNEYCIKTLADDGTDQPNRFVQNHAAMASIVARYPLSTFKLLQDLYEQLARLQKVRADVARAWLVSRGKAERPEDPMLAPHTPEWFAALETWNPVQAAHTRAAVAAAGAADVCSICGDDPAPVCQLPPEARLPGGVFTIRLCADCLDIRRGMGEPYSTVSGEG